MPNVVNPYAKMVRARPRKIVQKGSMSFYEMGGQEQKAFPRGNRAYEYYLLSDRGAGTMPLRLIGTWAGIIAFLTGQNDYFALGVMNTRKFEGDRGAEKVDTIGITVGRYSSPRANRSLHPVADSVAKVAASAAIFGAGAFTGAVGSGNSAAEMANDVGGGISDFGSSMKEFFGSAFHRHRKQPRETRFFVEFDQGGDLQLGRGQIEFDEIIPDVLKLLQKCCG